MHLIPFFSKLFPQKKKVVPKIKQPQKTWILDEILEGKAKALLTPYSLSLAAQVHVYWNPRLKTTAGMAFCHRGEVVLNPLLKTISEAEVERTLLHELAHLLAQERAGRKKIASHGREWKAACVDLGIPHESRTHQLPLPRRRQQRKFFYCCPYCQGTIERVRKPRRDIACLICCRTYARGRYDSRFKYEVIVVQQ